jgi:predicted alpha/beta hydrolase
VSSQRSVEAPQYRRFAVTEAAPRRIVSVDGCPIVGCFFDPPGKPKAGVLIASAMGVSQGFYAPLAQWLAGQGYAVATFDYRGIGLSRNGPLRDLAVDVVGWATRDCAATLDALSDRINSKPIYWIGHSLGGQIIPFVPNRERVTKFVTIAAGSGYWRENTPPFNRRALFLWYVVAPLTVKLFGYFPGKRLHIVGDLPAGVTRQWRRWCLDPEYAVGAEPGEVRALYAAVRTPIASLSFTDDEFMSARSIESLHGSYANAARTMKRFTPQDIGVKRIGHFGCFRAEFADCLWRRHLLPELSN